MLDFLDTLIWLLLSLFFFFVCGLHLAEKTLRTYCPRSRPYRIVIAVSSRLSFVMSQPFYAGENFFRVIMDFDRALPKPTRDRFKKKFLERFGIDAREDAEADIYWLSYLYVMENSSFAKDMIYKPLILSALHRNMGTSFLISSIFLSLPFTGINQDTHFTYLSLSFYVFSIFLSVRYYSIFSGYYSKTIFRRFALMN